jgi:hypothetical protein
MEGKGYAQWAVINGDLFSGNCPNGVNCAQGLTYIDGGRRENWGAYGNTWQVRGNIGFDSGRSVEVNVGDAQSKRHMTIAGGPRVLMGGSPTCNPSPQGDKTFFPDSGEWFDGNVSSWCSDTRAITMVGFSGDGRYLYFGVSGGGKTVTQLAQWLKDRGATQLLRLDSGGSAGMYHNGQLVAGSTDRAIANALAIYVRSGENPTATPPPGSCDLHPERAVLYSQPNFGGACTSLGPGEYPNPGHLGSVGNDNTRSLRVGEYARLTLYENENFQGRRSTFDASQVHDLRDSEISYDTSSARMEVRPTPQPTSTPTPTPTSIPDNSSPVVLWTAPIANGGVYHVHGETVLLAVDAHDNQGVVSVSFYRWDAVNEVWIDIEQRFTEPYHVNLDTGILNYEWNQIFARAADAGGNTTTQHIWLFRDLPLATATPTWTPGPTATPTATPTPICNSNQNGIVLYEHTYSMGRCQNFTSDIADLGQMNFGNMASSIRFMGNYAGRYQVILYDGTNFSGTSYTFEQNHNDFNQIGFNDLASSLKLVPRQISSVTHLPSILNVKTSASLFIPNGDFELGTNQGWNEYSSHNWSLVLSREHLPISPFSGQWAAWLGGESDEIAAIGQEVTVPTNFPYLRFAHWIASEDLCGYDFGGVVVNNTVVDVFDLCADTTANGWSWRQVNLSTYAGQVIQLQIRAETDVSLNSNLFVDDVQWSSNRSLPSAKESIWSLDNSPSAYRSKQLTSLFRSEREGDTTEWVPFWRQQKLR